MFVLQSDIHSEDSQLSQLQTFGWDAIGRSEESMLNNVVQSDKYFGIAPFNISKGDDDCKPEGFEFLAPTTCRNAMRVLRAMQLRKPVLLEGSPGVGKTSLIVAIGKYSGHRVVRINLSGQTDIMDLLGSDLPVEDAEGMRFAWSDGILLQALKNGDWVLLDELNLAPQSVLEGLNAILDHRAEVFIPELGQTYKCPTSFRVFACQNPSCQGGGWKWLPKSFLNRFTKVWVLLDKNFFSFFISARNLILFIFSGALESSKEDVFLNTVYIQRMRTAADRQEVVKLCAEVFGVKPFINPYPRLQHQWLCILVGPSASGKSSVVRLLADLTGNVLNELNLSSATDISELLGCFEQYNAFRSFRSALTQVERYIDEYCGLSLELEAIVLERKDLVSKWFKLLSSMYGNPTAASASAYADSWKSGSGSSLAPLILIVEQLKLGLEKYHFPVSGSAKNLNKVLKS
ncbi:hypothetical protein IFM89_023958, partial [Coptis chinensis]